MARKWTKLEEKTKKRELIRLYVRENKSIREIGLLLNIADVSVYDRLVRFGIGSLRTKKVHVNNQRSDILIPTRYSPELAEFVGIMLGDGNLTPTQVTVTLGKKDKYADYVAYLMDCLFGIESRILFSKNGDYVVYFGSTKIVRWFLKMGLVFNKVKSQVDVPRWIFSRRHFMRSALRGLFDTDGSVYRLRWGAQISFCNHSRPLIESVRRMLIRLDFHPSHISGFNLYLTRKSDIARFCKEIGFSNKKHIARLKEFRVLDR